MSGSQWFRRTLGFGLLGVVVMTVLVPAVALLRGTTGHDWYAASRLTAVEIMLAVGFDPLARVVEYRTRDGTVERISRRDLYFKGEALWARNKILITLRDHALLGGGVSLGMVLLMLIGAAGHGRRGRTGTALEPAEYPYRYPPPAGPAGRIADWVRPGLRARVALLVVSPAELERLLALLGQRRRPGFIDLPEPDGVEPMEIDGGLLERTEVPGLPPAVSGDQGMEAAVPAEPAPAGPGSRSDTTKPDDPTEIRAISPGREPGEQFF